MLKGRELVERFGRRSSVGTPRYEEAVQLKVELNQLGLAVRIVTRMKSGGNMSGLSAYRVTWWPNPG